MPKGFTKKICLKESGRRPVNNKVVLNFLLLVVPCMFTSQEKSTRKRNNGQNRMSPFFGYLTKKKRVAFILMKLITSYRIITMTINVNLKIHIYSMLCIY